MKRVALQPAFILHRRAYRESSFLVELLTKEYGRITAVARGVRKAKQGALGVLQQFVPLFVSWSGNGELVTVTQMESSGPGFSLNGDCLFAGIYLNELLTCLLHKSDPHPALFELYEKTITGLQGTQLNQTILRSFEKKLLEELGYGVLPDHSEHSFSADKYYRFVPDQGFMVSEIGEHSQGKSNIFSGRTLLAIAKEDWQQEDCLQDAKRLTRLVLMPLLGARQLHSRKLFMAVEE